MHLVFKRCKVVSIQLLVEERAAHLNIHDGRNVFSSSLFDELVLLDRRRITQHR